MHNFRVPPSHSWYTTPVCTPDHGVLYIAGSHSSIGYIPSPENASGRVQMVDLRYQCKAIACDTNWDDSRWFVALKADNEVDVWDLNSDTIVRGHRAHCGPRSSGEHPPLSGDGGAVCITIDRQVLSIAGKCFVCFCLRSNTYSVFRDDFVPKKRRPRVNLMRASPYDADLVALGFNDGLVEVLNIKKLSRLRTFNGHKTNIVSMEWIRIDPIDIEQEVESNVQRRLESSNEHSRSSSRNTLSDVDRPIEGGNRSNEECPEQAINISAEESNSGGEPAGTGPKEVDDAKDARALDATKTEDGSDQEPTDTETRDTDDCPMNGLEAQRPRCYLATGAEESLVYIWDTENNIIAHTIRLKTHGRSSIPKPIAMLYWITTTELVIINPNGTLSQWKIRRDAHMNEKCINQSRQRNERGIIGLCGSRLANATYYWTFSIFHQILLYQQRDGVIEVAGNYGTLPIGMYSIRECPHDLNKVAIAGNNKRIGIIDTLTMVPHQIDIQWLTADIQGNVRALAWHPVRENELSFSTDKNRIGTFDLTKPTAPNFWFNGKQAYRIEYGVTNEKATLYAYNEKGLTMYPDGVGGQNKGKTYDLKSFSFEICSINICDNYLSIGTLDGVFKLFTLDFTELYEKKLASKYISDISWQLKTKRHIAVSNTANGNINLFEFDAGETATVRINEFGVLTGHSQGVTWIKWSNQSANRLVSTGFDNTVRVWNTETQECLAMADYNGKMYCAIFLPGNDDLIACSGQSETLHVFDVREKAFVAANGEKKAKKQKSEVVWGVLSENGEVVVSIAASGGKKKQEKPEGSNQIEQQKVGNERLVEAQKSKGNTIFHISNREINRNAVTCLLSLLKRQQSPDEDDIDFLIAKITSKEEVQFVIEKELRQTKISSPDAIGNILLPQMNNDLKAQIMARTEAKLLTPQHVALAPSISFDFWRKCCLAYAFQTIEKGHVLEAVPYLLAIYQIKEAIDALCQKDYYREAWVIAKMKCDSDHVSVFQSIAAKWIGHLEYSGNYEGAALTAFLLETPDRALDILRKRKSTTPEIDEILILMQNLIANEETSN